MGMSAVHGRCLCGAVEFDVHDPQQLVECHCTRCRQWTGCASATVVIVPADGLEVTAGAELITEYRPEGYASRHFCARCGAGLYSGGPDTFYVAAGMLPDLQLAVGAHLQVADKAAWHDIGGGAPQFATFPG
jgi:hypothetical protein